MVRLYESPGRAGAGHLGPGFPVCRAEVTDLLERRLHEGDLAFGLRPFQILSGVCARSDYLRPTPLSPMWKILWLSRAMSTTSFVVVLPQVRVTTASV